MSLHVFVDETKSNCYLLVAAAVLPRDLARTRREVRRLALPGQRRVHFKHENPVRRRAIVSTICDLAVSAVVYDASAHPREHDARRAAMEALMVDAAEDGTSLILLEQDDRVIESDRRLLHQWTTKLGCVDRLMYEHRRPHEECLLWISDAVAWCWYKGGDWRRRVKPVVTATKKV